jgi:hypothetical protein
MNKNLLKLTANIYIKCLEWLIMIKNTILSASVILSVILAMQVLVKADLSTPAFAQGMTSKLQFRGRN